MIVPARDWQEQAFTLEVESSGTTGIPSVVAGTTREEPMPGHFRQWFAMHLIAVATNQFGNDQARALETDLIKFSKKTWPCLCENIAEDARGQCDGLNFIYMVVRD